MRRAAKRCDVNAAGSAIGVEGGGEGERDLRMAAMIEVGESTSSHALGRNLKITTTEVARPSLYSSSSTADCMSIVHIWNQTSSRKHLMVEM